MRGPVYPRALAARGIAAEIPGEHDREALDDLIVGELVRGVFTARAGRTASASSSAWPPKGCDAVAFACTELPLLPESAASPLPVLDSTRLLARAAYQVAAGHQALPGWRGGMTQF
jgi:aspartate/glutamate racemase